MTMRVANAASARTSRERAKAYLKKLESEVEKLSQENVQLKARVNVLETPQKHTQLLTTPAYQSDPGVMDLDMPNIGINPALFDDHEGSKCSICSYITRKGESLFEEIGIGGGEIESGECPIEGASQCFGDPAEIYPVVDHSSLPERPWRSGFGYAKHRHQSGIV
ncbi:uncharacterized protein LOC135806866 [Sycon ciliatum]|uniref:uncharacterized protein LOC135806866 n=1 Tax=Sycon ciliatum TaxID=27933 RepID=UPI0031F607A2